MVRKTASERFWAKVDKSAGPDGCWIWLGRANGGGYGQFADNSVRHLTHRLSYEWATGNAVPKGMVVDHKCHLKMCVNPAHLQVVTVSENAQNRRGPAANNRAGVRGVYMQAGRWRVQIRAGGRNVSGGMFTDLAEAEAAAIALRARMMSNSLADLEVSA